MCFCYIETKIALELQLNCKEISDHCEDCKISHTSAFEVLSVHDFSKFHENFKNDFVNFAKMDFVIESHQSHIYTSYLHLLFDKYSLEDMYSV